MRLAVFILLLSCVARAESTGGAWLMLFNSIQLNERWDLSSDFQLRQSGAYDVNRQTLTRTSLNYAIGEGIRVGAGYAYVDATDYDRALETPSSENRLFEQLELRHAAGAAAMGHRVRVEQRFVQQTGTSNALHRFRYRISGRYPRASEPGLYVSTYNEFFIDLGRGTWPTFSQNRFYFGLGHPLTELRNLRAEMGYLWQALRREPRESLSVHALQLALAWDL